MTCNHYCKFYIIKIISDSLFCISNFQGDKFIVFFSFLWVILIFNFVVLLLPHCHVCCSRVYRFLPWLAEKKVSLWMRIHRFYLMFACFTQMLLPCLKLGLLKDVISSELNWDWLRYIISHLENLLFLFKGLKFLAESLLLLDLLVTGIPFKQKLCPPHLDIKFQWYYILFRSQILWN